MENAAALIRHLIEAILDNDVARARSALEMGANPNVRDRDYPGVWRLLSYDPPTGLFPLYEAVTLNFRDKKRLRKNAKNEVVEVLLEFGSDLDMADDSGYTVCHQAAALGDQKTLRLLIDRGSKLDLQSKKGYTPLHTAVYGEADACVHMLLSAGADFEVMNIEGFSPAQYAGKLRRNNIRALLESHAAMRAITVALSEGISNTSPQSRTVSSAKLIPR